jgi:hypothetical protein
MAAWRENYHLKMPGRRPGVLAGGSGTRTRRNGASILPKRFKLDYRYRLLVSGVSRGYTSVPSGRCREMSGGECGRRTPSSTSKPPAKPYGINAPCP